MKRRKAAQLELPLAPGTGELVTRAHIGLGNRPLSYTLKRSARRRRITLTIDEQGLRVGAPLDATQHAIDGMLRSHEGWVLRKLAEWQARRMPPPRWTDGEILTLLGAPLRLTLVSGRDAPLRNGAQLVIGQTAGDLAQAVVSWLKREALACFHARVAHFAPALGVPAPDVRLSSARTRWGSCHAAGRVLLHWRLVQCPLRLIDYVVVHELAHLREMNHSPRFWRIVGGLLPDYAARKSEIRTEGSRYLRV